LIGFLGKLFGIKGLFYMIAGEKARSIDGAVPYAIPPYNNYVSKGPINANEVAEKIAKKIGVLVAIVDANDFGVNILGISKGVDKKLIAKIIKDNPLGQSDEQTPIGIIRRVSDTNECDSNIRMHTNNTNIRQKINVFRISIIGMN
jgi:hypothetical protein